MKLLTPGSTANTPGDVTLVPTPPAEGYGKQIAQQSAGLILGVELYQERH